MLRSKTLFSLVLGAITIPAVTLISCSSNNLTDKEKAIQESLIANATINTLTPKITLNKDIEINKISSKILNFDEFQKKDINKKYKNILFEVLYFEIPEINSTDTKVWVKVSSKLDKTIFEKYSFNVSDSIEAISKGKILPMTNESFNDLVKKRYLDFDKNQASFKNPLINLVNSKIKESNIDITNPINNITNPINNLNFNQQIQKIISFVVVKKLNESLSNNEFSSYYQSNLSVSVGKISRIYDKLQPTILDKNKLNQANISLIINIGDSPYKPLPFIINTFSTKYDDLTKQLLIIEEKKFLPILWKNQNGKTISFSLSEILKNSSIEIPNEFNKNNEFIIGITKLIKNENIPKNSKINITISSKSDFSISGSYDILVSEIKDYDKLIDFTIKPTTIKVGSVTIPNQTTILTSTYTEQNIQQYVFDNLIIGDQPNGLTSANIILTNVVREKGIITFEASLDKYYDLNGKEQTTGFTPVKITFDVFKIHSRVEV